MREKLDLIKIYLFYFILFVIIILINGLSIENVKGVHAIIIGCAWMIITILFYMLYLRKSGNIYAIIAYAIFNALLSGVTISAYYSLKNVTPYKPEFIIQIFAALLIVNLCLTLLIRKRLVFSIINLVITIILLCASGYIWAEKDKTLGSSLFFMLVVYLCFGIAQLIVEKEVEARINLISISSLLMFGGILLVVLVAISEGDALDALDVIPEGSGNKKAKR
jgi:hypothetical protein